MSQRLCASPARCLLANVVIALASNTWFSYPSCKEGVLILTLQTRQRSLRDVQGLTLVSQVSNRAVSGSWSVHML